MKDEMKIVSLTPAIAGWWAKFRDDIEWYSPVAAWALCRMSDDECLAYDVILPVLTGEEGMTPHHEEQGYCELFYLPDEKFRLSGGEYCYAWVKSEEHKATGVLNETHICNHIDSPTLRKTGLSGGGNGK